MRTTLQMSITLPRELAQAVKARVASGEYATESEVIRDGLRALLARDRVMEHWLRNQIPPAHETPQADPPHAAEPMRMRLAPEVRKIALRK